MSHWDNGPLLHLDGVPVYPFRGAEGEGNEGGQGGSQGGSGDQGTGGQSAAGQQGNGQGAGGQSATTATVSQVEFDALKAQLSAADKKREEAEGKLKGIEDADKSDLEKANSALEEANKTIEKLRGDGQAMLISNAFHEVKDPPKWHNAKAALQLLDRSIITVEDDGTVKGMDAAVKKLKEAHPYLVKDDDASKDGKGGSGGSGGNGGQTGTHSGGTGGGGQNADRETQGKRFPALRGR